MNNTHSNHTQNTNTQVNTGSNPLSRRVNTVHRPSTQEEILSRRKCGEIPDSLFRDSKRSGRAADQLHRLRRIIQRHKRSLAEHAHEAITYEVIDGVRKGLTRTLQDLELSRTDRCGVRSIRRLGQRLSRVRLRLKVTGRFENGADVGRIGSKLGIHPNRDEEGRRGVQYGLHRAYLDRPQCTLCTRLLQVVPTSYAVRTLMVSTRTREGVLEGRPTSSTPSRRARDLDDRDLRAPRTYTNPCTAIQVRTLTGPARAYRRSTTASQLNTGDGDGRTVPRYRRRCSHEG